MKVFTENCCDKYKRIYSDIDFIVYYKNELRTDNSWFLIAERQYWKIYRIGMITGRYPVECLFIKDEYRKRPEIILKAEEKGIPMEEDSKVPHKSYTILKSSCPK